MIGRPLASDYTCGTGVSPVFPPAGHRYHRWLVLSALPWWLVAIAPICCLSAHADAAPKERSVATGPHVRVICHFEDAKIAQQALRTAQKAWAPAAKLYGVNDAALFEPSAIHLFRHAEEYMAAQTKLAGGRFRHNLAFSSRRRRAAYIAIQPSCSDRTLAAVGLPALTLRQIAHETAHLASFDAPADGRPQAQWFAEGAATWIAELAMAEMDGAPKPESDPFTATDMRRAQNLLHGGSLPAVHQILKDDYGPLRYYERYAVQWLFFRFLMTDARARWDRSFNSHPRSVGGRQATVTTRLMSWAPAEVDALDKAFKRYVHSLVPQWHEQGRSLAVQGDNWTQMAFADTDAVAWTAKPAGAVAYRIRGSLEFLPNHGRQMNLLLGRDRRGHVVVSFLAESGITVRRYRAVDNQFEKLGEQWAISRAKEVHLSKRFTFDIVVAPGSLRILINDKPCLTVDPGNADLTGPWGVGAKAGSAGVWRNVQLRPEE